jgi:hypothetical protein
MQTEAELSRLQHTWCAELTTAPMPRCRKISAIRASARSSIWVTGIDGPCARPRDGQYPAPTGCASNISISKRSLRGVTTAR